MCISPNTLPNGTRIGCRKCWQCRERRIDDWVGRCIAESKTAEATFSVTLTYGPDSEGNKDHPRAAVLTYSDCQKYFKLLRKNGYPCRYFAVGEYGSAKGRSHWHVIVFFTGEVPEHEINRRFQERHWPHGYSHWEKPTQKSIRYVCKYLQKDMGIEEKQGHMSMSKKPPLGDEYFKQLAQEYIDNGLAPQSPHYTFSEATTKHGKPTRFYMTGTTLDNFCKHYLHEWWEINGTHPPTSKMLEDYEDRVAPEVLTLQMQKQKTLASLPTRFDLAKHKDVKIKWCEKRQQSYLDLPIMEQVHRFWWCFNEQGKREWQEDQSPEDKSQRNERLRKSVIVERDWYLTR